MTNQEQVPARIVIVGAGIVGLVLALAIKKNINITPELYEQAPAFHDDVGAGMGMYPNGLRVIRDISPSLLKAIRNAGHPYLYRRWEVRSIFDRVLYE
jgi:salicylate hydroxylase